MTRNTDTAATVWLTELDDIDISWNTTTFACSRLGRLPTELLDGIIKYVPTSDLPAVARISRGLRGLAEQYLYTDIDLNRKSSVRWSSPVCYDRLWILYRTLGRRPDLAQTINTFSVTLFDEEVSIDSDTSSLFPGDIQLSLAVQVSLKQILIGSRIWQLLTNLKELQMTINRSSYSGMLAGETLTRKEMMASNPLSHLLPTFHHATAHTIQHPGLQKLTHLEFGGAEFHWALAKSPSLRKLRLTRPCVFLSDEEPEEVNASLKVLEMEARSAILRKHSNRYTHLRPFLAHFPALEELTVRIFDLDVDILYNSRDYQVEDDVLDYTNLLDKISAIAAHLVELDIGVYTNDDDEGDDEVNFHLSEVRPGPGFQQFKALKSLIVPYQCLLGRTFSSVDALPSPAAILPPGLDTLDVHCPQIYLYDWLARLQVVRDRLPLLQWVRLYCQSPHGDTADLFEYVHHDHRGVQVLTELGIGLWLSWHVRDEKEEWNDYDLNMLQAVEWIESLGS